ncbi:MAG: hypothetical protein R2725_12725 [Solirubrobacterales bacterium]
MQGRQFAEIMRRGFVRDIDDFWGPPLPNVHRAAAVRELMLAFSVASLADRLELAQKGMGRSMLEAYMDDPVELCPPWPWPWPREREPGPEPPLPIDKAVLGAAFVFSADFIHHEELAAIAAKRGGEMIG